MKKKYIISSIVISSSMFMLTSCFQDQAKVAELCPLTPMAVIRVSYNETANQYLVFHTSSTKETSSLPNPLKISNLPMSQLAPAQGNTSTDFARISFKKETNKCSPILEMTPGYKIELISGESSVTNSTNNHSSNSGGGGGYWAPFLMGAIAGHTLSNLTTPTYYLPPPASSAHGGLVTGGVSASSPVELDKKYQEKYHQPSKKGFFSSNKSFGTSDSNQQKKSGFFSRKGSASPSRSRSGSFFRKK